MPVPTGRTQRRIAKEVVVELARPGSSPIRETALPENVSSRGMRVATEHVWGPGERVLLSAPEAGVCTEARIVYCEQLESKRFAIGLELLESLEG
jgi:hypothetical protein